MMTWKEFKDKVESQGVTDDLQMQYIDVDGFGEPEVKLDRISNLNGGVQVFSVTSGY